MDVISLNFKSQVMYQGFHGMVSSKSILKQSKCNAARVSFLLHGPIQIPIST